MCAACSEISRGICLYGVEGNALREVACSSPVAPPFFQSVRVRERHNGTSADSRKLLRNTSRQILDGLKNILSIADLDFGGRIDIQENDDIGARSDNRWDDRTLHALGH